MSVTRNYRQLVKLDEAQYLDLNAIESVSFSTLAHAKGDGICANVLMESGTRLVFTATKAQRISDYLDIIAQPIGTHDPLLAVEHQRKPADIELNGTLASAYAQLLSVAEHYLSITGGTGLIETEEQRVRADDAETAVLANALRLFRLHHGIQEEL